MCVTFIWWAPCFSYCNFRGLRNRLFRWWVFPWAMGNRYSHPSSKKIRFVQVQIAFQLRFSSLEGGRVLFGPKLSAFLKVKLLFNFCVCFSCVSAGKNGVLILSVFRFNRKHFWPKLNCFPLATHGQIKAPAEDQVWCLGLNKINPSPPAANRSPSTLAGCAASHYSNNYVHLFQYNFNDPAAAFWHIECWSWHFGHSVIFSFSRPPCWKSLGSWVRKIEYAETEVITILLCSRGCLFDYARPITPASQKRKFSYTSQCKLV